MSDLSPGLTLSLVLGLSLLLDQLGELPSRIHPVVGMGHYLNWIKGRNRLSAWAAFRQGAVYLTLGCLIVTGTAGLLVYLLSFLPIWLKAFLLALLLQPLFSFRALLKAGDEVKRALEREDLPEARRLLSWHLVSRDTAELSESEVAGAATESLAENLSDSVIAPLFYFALFGLPGAALYRFVNTADAVLGYHTPELEYFGKMAARLDDLLNLIPARLTFLLLCLSAAFVDADPVQTWRVALRDAKRTVSPNAGWPMAAVAGGLGIKLDKRDTYCLNELGSAPTSDAIGKTERWLLAASLLGVLGFSVVSLGRYA